MKHVNKLLAVLTAIPVTFAGVMMLPSSALAETTVPADGLVAEYSFENKPDDGITVDNTASASEVGAAEVQNPSDSLWSDKALTLTGGSKEGTGSWVKLPADLLAGSSSATVQIEVKADPSMLSAFHFLWNIGNSSPNTEYFFASLNCGSNRRPLVGIKSSAVETLVQSASCTAKANQWMSVTATIDGSTKSAKLYIDGKAVAAGTVPADPSHVADQSLNTIGRAPWPDNNFKGAVSTMRVYDTALSAEEIASISDDDARIHEDEIANAVIDGLDFADQTVNASYIALPSEGGAVTWTSSDESIITNQGVVNQPAKGEDDRTVTLTATTVTRGLSSSRSYTITVKASDKSTEELLADAATGYVIPTVLESGTSLPSATNGTEVSFAASDGITVSEDGRLSITGEERTSGSVTATISKAGAASPVQKTFKVQVLPASKAQTLAVYDRNATSVDEANNGDVAHSMHLALKDDDDAAFTTLNENYGIFFPLGYASQPLNMNTVDYARSLKDPSVLYMADGSYGIVSVRTKRGTDTADARNSILLATSDDLLSYHEDPNSAGIIDVGETNGVNHPYAVYDSASTRYLVGWSDDNGVSKYTTFEQLIDADSQHGEVLVGEFSTLGIMDADTAGGIENFRAGSTIPIDEETASALDVRFGRSQNTGVSNLSDITVKRNSSVDALQLPAKAELTYSDGSTGSLPIESWDTSDVDLTKVGEYTVSGTVKQTSYKVPFAEERADPSVYKWNWKHQVDGKDVTEIKYLMIATNDIYGDVTWQRGTPHMPFRMADSIEALADTPGEASGLVASNGYNPKENILLSAGAKDSDGNSIMHSFWAPEIHEIDGRLTILFMAGYGSTWSNGKSVYMQLKQDANGNDLDPTQAANWDTPHPITRSDGSALATAANGSVGMSLDMTYFQDEQGQSYYAWQQLGATYIATMDPSDPSHITSTPVRIVAPEYAWNVTIAEGPNVTTRDGKLYLMYSGSSVGKTYTTGLAVADASGNTDLTDPSSWSNLNYPIQKSGIFNGSWQLGTGHGMWSEDEDGNQIYVFHAYANQSEGYRNYSGRDTFVRRVHWAADGMPVFDMDSSEELASASVSFKVNVVSDDVSVDKTALSQTIRSARQLSAKDYTVATWKAFSAALAAAQDVYADDGASQQQVDDAEKALAAAMDSLVRSKGDTDDGGTGGNGTGGNGTDGNDASGTGNGGAQTGDGDATARDGVTGLARSGSALAGVAALALICAGVGVVTVKLRRNAQR